MTAPAGTTIATVEGFRVTTGERTQGTVSQVRRVTSATRVSVPEDRALLVAYGRREADLAGLQIGEVLGVTTRFAPEATAASLWEGLDGAVAGDLVDDLVSQTQGVIDLACDVPEPACHVDLLRWMFKHKYHKQSRWNFRTHLRSLLRYATAQRNLPRRNPARRRSQ